MSFIVEVKTVHDRKALILESNKLKVRKDWHEPDEQRITALVTGGKFDNAGVRGEMEVLVMKEGKPVFAVNLATLFAFATGYEGGF